MASAEKCSLVWQDFQETAGHTFRDLREDGDFCDVTLVCEDNHQIPSHKVVLAASSPLLRDMLKSSQHSHPLLYFWGIKARDLSVLVDFIYKGQVQVYQSDLADFLNLAKLLKVNGVSEGNTSKEIASRSGKEVKKENYKATRANYMLLPETIKEPPNDPLEGKHFIKDNSAVSDVTKKAVFITSGAILDSFTIDVTDNTIVTCNKCGNKLHREKGNKSLHNHMRIHAQKNEDVDSRHVLEQASGREQGTIVPIKQSTYKWDNPNHQPELKQEMEQDQKEVEDGRTIEDLTEKAVFESMEDQEFNGVKIGMDALKNWYTIDESDVTKAYCKVCQKQVSRGKTGSPKTKQSNKLMKVHLKKSHLDDYKVLLSTCKEQMDLHKDMVSKEEIRKNKVWKYFEEDDNNPTVVVCQVKVKFCYMSSAV